jgi:hypothetical protein
VLARFGHRRVAGQWHFGWVDIMLMAAVAAAIASRVPISAIQPLEIDARTLVGVFLNDRN